MAFKTVESYNEARFGGFFLLRNDGVADAVKHVLKDADMMKPCVINGITKESIRDLKKYAKNGSCPDCNMIEVMCCEGGCVCGNATINNERSAKKIIGELLKESEDL